VPPWTGYLAAVLLLATGCWSGYEWLETALGEALCDSGDCSKDGNGAALYLALAVTTFVGAALAGWYGWRRDLRQADAANRPTLGAGILLGSGVVALGLIIGVAALEATH